MVPAARIPRVHDLPDARAATRATASLAMSFVATTATKLGIPHATVQRATAKLLELLRERARPDDMQTLLTTLPELSEHDRDGASPGTLQRLVRSVARFGRAARATRTSLQRTGLGYVDVAFVSAFAGYLREHVEAKTTARLIDSVPGLSAMTSWPITPHKQTPWFEDASSAAPEPADPERSAPSSMS